MSEVDARNAAYEAVNNVLPSQAAECVGAAFLSDTAIDAFLSELGKAGYVVVPREPTVGMLKALTTSWPQDDESRAKIAMWGAGSFNEDYAAMIEAALASSVSGKGE